jgi:hypothetical protein
VETKEAVQALVFKVEWQSIAFHIRFMVTKIPQVMSSLIIFPATRLLTLTNLQSQDEKASQTNFKAKYVSGGPKLN